MEEDNGKKNVGKGEQIFDQFSDKLKEMDLEGLSDSIRESVDYIKREAENGYRNFRVQPSDELKKFGKYYETPYERYKAEQKRRQDMAQGQMQGQAQSQRGQTHTGEHRIRREQYTENYIRKENAPVQEKTKSLKNLIKLIPGRTQGPVEMGIGLSMLLIFGGITFGAGIVALLTAFAGGIVHAGVLGLTIPLTIVGGAFLGHGILSKNRANRLIRCAKEFVGKEYLMIKDLAAETGESEDQLRKDLHFLVDKNVIPGLTMDEKETCLLFSDNARMQYAQAEQGRLAREAEEKKKKAEQDALEQKKHQGTKEERELIYFEEQVEAFYVDVKEMKEEINSPVIQKQMGEIELLLHQITDCVKEHPEMISDTGHLVSYYLPCMSKLLKTYEDLEEQPIQGDNIIKTKAEIEESFDTIKAALTNMYDEMFRDVSMDISSDIQVMKAMMAQDGWNEGFKMSGMDSGMDLKSELEQEAAKK